MAKMTAAEAMIKILESEGVEVIFGIPGAGISRSTVPYINQSK